MSKFDHIEEVNKNIDHIEHVEKFNPYHDAKGRFASASGYASFTFRTKDPNKQHMADLAVAREKERHAASADSGEKRIASAEEKLKGSMRANAVVNLKGCDPEVAENTVAAAEKVLSRYPNAKDAFAGITTEDHGYFAEHAKAMACFDPNTKLIHLNTSMFGDKTVMQEKYNTAVEKKHFPKGTDYSSTIVHEMGHALDWHVSVEVIGQQKVYWQGDKISSRLWNNEIKAAKKAGTPLKGSDITEALSRYASSSAAEYFAEGFSEYISSASPRPAAMKIGKRFETYYKKLGGE